MEPTKIRPGAIEGFCAAIDLLQGDREIFSILGETFIAEASVWLEDFATTSHQGDIEKLRQMLHLYRGFVGQIGATFLLPVLASIHRDLLYGVLPDEQALLELRTEFTRTTTDLCTFMSMRSLV